MKKFNGPKACPSAVTLATAAGSATLPDGALEDAYYPMIESKVMQVRYNCATRGDSCYIIAEVGVERVGGVMHFENI